MHHLHFLHTRGASRSAFRGATRPAVGGALLCLVLGVLGACAGGDFDTRRNESSADLAKIVIQNMSATAGPAVTEVVVALAPGAFAEPPRVRTEFNAACQSFAMGPRYDDGSVRYLRLEVLANVAANGRQTLRLLSTSAPDPEFRRHASISGVIGANFGLRVGNTTVAFPEPTLLEGGPVTQVYRSRLRAPTGSMVWGELTVMIFTGLPHARFTVQWGLSHPGSPALFEDPGQVELKIAGAAVRFDDQGKVIKQSNASGTTLALLHDGGDIADGQSQLVAGRLLYGTTADSPQLHAIATNWGEFTTFGPFGYLMPEIRVDPTAFDKRVGDEIKKHVDHPWARPVHGCNPDPRDTGNQTDFGSTVMREDALLADPGRLQTVLRSVYQEACRPTHHREVDVSRVIVANHPKLLTLDGRQKKERDDSDLLGKPNKWLTKGARSPEGDRWNGHDTEHLSINYLGTMALLTGNRFAREECAHHAMLYLTGFTHNTGFYNDSVGPARKVGRSSLCAIWIWLITGRNDVAARVVDRVDDIVGLIASKKLPFVITAPRGSSWTVWEEGNAATGLAAIYKNFGSRVAIDLALQIGETVTMNGMATVATDKWRCAYKPPMRRSDGKPYRATLDTNFKNIAAGSGLTLWGSPCLFIVAYAHPDAAVRKQASTIIQANYGGTTDGLSIVLSFAGVTPESAFLAKMTSAY